MLAYNAMIFLNTSFLFVVLGNLTLVDDGPIVDYQKLIDLPVLWFKPFLAYCNDLKLHINSKNPIQLAKCYHEPLPMAPKD